ncbi:MAG TPA: TMEM175 family protein [Candidatus Dormibacteraeota bacterium]
MSRGRLEAFSDGVIAVAITLLALNLAVEGPGHGPLANQLVHRWPVFAAYVISFFTVGIIWVNHHALLQQLAVVDRTVLFINLVLLLFVVAIPFGTALMASYLTIPGLDSRLAMAVYCAILEGMSLGFAALFSWSLGEGRRHQPVPEEARRSTWWRFTFGGFLYILAGALGFISPPLALAMIGVIAVYYIFERLPVAQPTRQ